MTDEDVKQYFKKRITIDKKTGCWNWNLSCDKNKYARCHLRRYPPIANYALKACRVSYLVFNGEIPEDLFILHHCDNRKCINPKHLHVGTHQDNMDEMAARGRSRSPRNFGNNFRGHPILADGKIYDSYSAAGLALGISDNGVRKRIKLGWIGYERS